MNKSKIVVTVMLSFFAFGCTTFPQSSLKADEKTAPSYEGSPQEAVDAIQQNKPFYFSAFMKARILSWMKKPPSQYPEVLHRVANEGDNLVQLIDQTCQGRLNPTYAGFQDPYPVGEGEYLLLFNCTTGMRSLSFRFLHYSDSNGLNYVPLELETMEQTKVESPYQKVKVVEFWAFRPTFDKILKEFTFSTERSSCPNDLMSHKACSYRIIYRYKEGRLVLQKFLIVLRREGKSEELTQVYP